MLVAARARAYLSVQVKYNEQDGALAEHFLLNVKKYNAPLLIKSKCYSSQEESASKFENLMLICSFGFVYCVYTRLSCCGNSSAAQSTYVRH